ncbi:MAG: nuclear transport factor 2 family protein [Cyclobacteriaceae bacterium]
MKITSFGILLIWLVACKPSSSEVSSDYVIPVESSTNQEEEVLQKIEAYYQVFSDRDWPVFRSFFWDNATLTTIWQPAGASGEQVMVTSIDEFIEQTPQGPDSQPVFEEKMTDAEVKMGPGLAQVWADYEATFGQPDSLMHWTGTDAFTLLKHQDEWRIVSLVFVSH